MIQLSKNGIPSELKDLLEDRSIIKAGLATLQDAKNLNRDYGLDVQGTLDLRFLARDTSHHPGGLKRLAKDILGGDIGQDIQILLSDWTQARLNTEQMNYAKAAVAASSGICKNLLEEKFGSLNAGIIMEYARPMLDRYFS